MKFLMAVILLCCIAGCSNKSKSRTLLSTEKMEAVMWDIIGADVFTEQFIKKDSLKKASLENVQLQNKIFASHKVNREDYYYSYDYYIGRADLMKMMLDSLSARAERDRSKMTQLHYNAPHSKGPPGPLPKTAP